MIDIDNLRKNPDDVIANLEKRGVAADDVKKLVALDEQWRTLAVSVDQLRAEQNQASTKISQADGEEKKNLIADMKQLSDDLQAKQKELETTKQAREAAWRQLPNLVLPEVQEGGEEDVKVIRYVPAEVKDQPAEKNYLDLTEPDYIDLSRAAKVSGSRFAYIKGDLARLQIALVSFVFDKLREQNFTPVMPPVLISTEAMAGMGYLDKHAEEIYQTQDDMCLVGTSEQSIGPMHKDEILSIDELPIRYVGYSSCFRREAGSHGKDVKGIMRMHQFEKIEMFSITAPDQSGAEHDFLLSQEEALMQALELPYRVIQLAAGDLGGPSAKTYDIETWMPSEGRYRETHSTSNTTDYQARRLNIRVKDKEGTVAKAHMLNGTAFAIGRILIALIENHTKDGVMSIPKALHSYLPFTEIKFRGAE